MSGFKRPGRSRIDTMLTAEGRGWIQRDAVRSRHLSGRDPRRRQPRAGAKCIGCSTPTPCSRTLDEIEGFRPGEPDASLYTRVETPVTFDDGHVAHGVGLFLQRAARPRAADRIRRLSRASQGEVMTRRDRVRWRSCSRVLSSWSGFSRTVSAQASDLDPRIVKLVASVSEERLGTILKQARELRDAQLAVVDRLRTTRGIGAARAVDSRRDAELQPEAAGELRHLPGAEAGPHHARRRAAQRDGGAAGPQPAPHLRQRPLRHGGPAGRPGRVERRRSGARSRRAGERRRPIPTRRSTTSRPASTTTAAARR